MVERYEKENRMVEIEKETEKKKLMGVKTKYDKMIEALSSKV